MKKITVFFLSVVCCMAVLAVSCVKNSTQPATLDTSVGGKWEGYILPIDFGSVHFDGAFIFLNFSAKDSTFRMIARDTTEMRAAAKDTILILSGAWAMKNSRDSVIMQCSFCRVIDTTGDTLYNRAVESQRIALPETIEKSDAGLILWQISFGDLSSLIPLLGLTIPDSDQGLLKAFKIQLQKIDQDTQDL